jgi:hypothetical protein
VVWRSPREEPVRLSMDQMTLFLLDARTVLTISLPQYKHGVAVQSKNVQNFKTLRDGCVSPVPRLFRWRDYGSCLNTVPHIVSMSELRCFVCFSFHLCRLALQGSPKLNMVQT